jgi:hypothetical protein
MSNVAGVSISAYRSQNIRQAICNHCGNVVIIHVPDFRAREISLWWPAPLAVIIWLAIIFKFSNFLASPKVETPLPASIEASFVELSDDKSKQQAKSPELQPKPRPRPTKKVPAHDATRVADNAEPIPPAEPAPTEQPVPIENTGRPTDLMSYVKSIKERRRVAEMAAQRENAEASARERGPTAEEIRNENIRRNLQSPGTNGIFQIISVGTRTGKFSFRGWTNDYSNAQRETIEVDAGQNGDVERAMVRRMIEIIRKYYKGDFNWDSQRLGREIVLSARIEDNSGLEKVLMREFFGAGSGR